MVLERRRRACPPRLAARTHEIASLTGHAALAESSGTARPPIRRSWRCRQFLNLGQNAKRTASGKRTPPMVANGDQGLKMLIQFQLPALTLRNPNQQSLRTRPEPTHLEAGPANRKKKETPAVHVMTDPSDPA